MGRRRRRTRVSASPAAGTLLALLLVLASAATILSGQNDIRGDGSGGDSPQANGLLTLDARVDDPVDWVVGLDVEVANADASPSDIEIVRVGYDYASWPLFPNISASHFDGSQLTTFTGFDSPVPGWYNRVEVGRLFPGPAPQIAVVGAELNMTTFTTNGTVSFYTMNSPLQPGPWMAVPAFVPGGNMEFTDMGIGELHMGHPGLEYIAVGHHAPGQMAWDSRGFLVLGYWDGGPFVGTIDFGDFAGSWLYYNAVATAELDGAPPMEMVFAGRRNNASFLSIGFYNESKFAFEFLANATYQNLPDSGLWAVSVRDMDADSRPDIVTGGYESLCVDPCQGDENYSRVSIWDFEPVAKSLTMKKDRVWTGFHADSKVQDVEISDHDLNGVPEVSSIGYTRNYSANLSMEGELSFMDNQLKELDKMEWSSSDTNHWGLDSADADGDGELEIVSVGWKSTGITTGQTNIAEVGEFRGEAAVAFVSLASAGFALRLRAPRKRRPQSI